MCEIKGIRALNGGIRLSEKEFCKAKEFKELYLLVMVLNLENNPKFKSIANPLAHLTFTEKIIKAKEQKEYHSFVSL